jgi:site-specific recombinase XerD
MTALRQKFIDEMELRGFSENTTRSYISMVRDLARHFKRSPDQIKDEELKQYLLHRIREEKCAAATIVVNVSALRFFYQHVVGRSIEELAEALPRMRKPLVRPRAYSPEQIEKLLSAQGLNLKHRVLLTTTYAAGLRVSEVCQLKPTDIMSARMQIRIEQGKGNKDRFVVLSPKLLEVLRVYWKTYRPRHWLFPGNPPDKPLTRISALRVFYRAVTLSGLPKLGGIHCLRHSYATHCLEAGVDVVTLKRLLGHSKLATTANYLHISQQRLDTIQSPLDRITLNLSSTPS